MRMEKITYRSRADDLDIPAFVFQPLTLRGADGHPALVWVHENIRGHLYEHYIPYVREAVAKGFVVIAPEYRGSIGYGQAFYDAIDYGGAEVDDVVTAVELLKSQYPHVDPLTHRHHRLESRRHDFAAVDLPEPEAVSCSGDDGAGHQPVSSAGVERLSSGSGKRSIRTTASAAPRRKSRTTTSIARRSSTWTSCRSRSSSPSRRNDDDVNIEEDMQLVDALRSRKPLLAETKIYDDPPGGHEFDRRVDPKTFEPENTREQRDSWERVWTFLDWNLETDKNLERRTQH